MAEFAITDVARAVVTVADVSGRHDAKGADGSERTALGSPQRVFAITRIVDHFAVAPARQVQTARERLARVGGTVPRIAIPLGASRIVPIAMICAVTCVVPIVVAFTLVMGLGGRTWTTAKRQPVVIVIPIALVPIAVAWVALVPIVAWIEIHNTSAELTGAALTSDAELKWMCA